MNTQCKSCGQPILEECIDPISEDQSGALQAPNGEFIHRHHDCLSDELKMMAWSIDKLLERMDFHIDDNMNNQEYCDGIRHVVSELETLGYGH
jgi:hypothetical protein